MSGSGSDFVPWPPQLAARWRAEGYWTGQTLGALLRQQARARAGAVALVAGEERITYGELDDRVDRLSRGLAGIGLSAGDRAILQIGNAPAFVEGLFALLRLGVLPVFALPAHRHRELGHFAAISGARAHLIGALDGRVDENGLAERVRGDSLTLESSLTITDLTRLRDGQTAPAAAAVDAAGPRPQEFAFLQLSGGSTGLPKLIPRTHDEYAYTLRRSAELCGLGPGSIYLAALPAAHNFPLSSPGILGTIAAGGRIVLAPDPSPGTCFTLIERERVTITGLVPPLALAWLDAARARPHDLSSLEVLQVGGAKLPDGTARRVRPELGCRLQQVYGMAEGLVCYTRLDDAEERIVTTQGRPMAAADELRVVDEDDRIQPPGATGSLQTRGPYTIQGYYRAPEHNARAFTADGWYRTGDIARVTADGDVVVEGRDKDQINRGGEKIAAAEVEDVLLGHPAVHDVALIALPDPALGERTCAVIVPDGPAPRPPELRRFVAAAGLAAFKLPDRFVFVEQLPYTHIGKVSKADLRARLSQPKPKDTAPAR